MRARWFDGVLVMASWALVAVPAVMLLAGNTQQIERWLVVATVVPLLGLLSQHYVISMRLEKRNRTLADSLTQMQMAEELAGVGRWSIDMSTLEHRWSAEVCRLFGLSTDCAPTPELLAKRMPEGLRQLEIALQNHAVDQQPYAVEFEIEHAEHGPRVLRARARNDFDAEDERAQVFMVVRDVSDEYSLVETIEREREAAEERAQEATRLANTDPLTGLANRRLAMKELDRAIMAARTSNEPVSLIVFDIDHFKAVNDSHGHQTGDKVIAVVAQIAARQARDADVVARIGGEEFSWLVPGADASRAAELAERLRLAIEAGTMSAPIPSVTASIGHATLDAGDTSLLLFARADEALYAAKRAGRNRVALAA